MGGMAAVLGGIARALSGRRVAGDKAANLEINALSTFTRYQSSSTKGKRQEKRKMKEVRTHTKAHS